jgi:hypothetical protein
MTRTIEEVERENTKLRGILANSPLPCLYCALPKADMAKCPSGFPGCGRADDIVLDPNFGAGLDDELA